MHRFGAVDQAANTPAVSLSPTVSHGQVDEVGPLVFGGEQAQVQDVFDIAVVLPGHVVAGRRLLIAHSLEDRP